MDWTETGSILARILGAFLLALPIGWEREKSTRSMAMRTFPLVAMASAAYLVLAESCSPTTPRRRRGCWRGW